LQINFSEPPTVSKNQMPSRALKKTSPKGEVNKGILRFSFTNDQDSSPSEYCFSLKRRTTSIDQPPLINRNYFSFPFLISRACELSNLPQPASWVGEVGKLAPPGRRS
jgi:hypothetical protein